MRAIGGARSGAIHSFWGTLLGLQPRIALSVGRPRGHSNNWRLPPLPLQSVGAKRRFGFKVRRAPPLGGCRGPPQAQVRRAPPLGGQLGAHARLRGDAPPPLRHSRSTFAVRPDVTSPSPRLLYSKYLHTTRVDGVRGRDGPGGASPPILLLYVTFVGRTHVAREWPKHRENALEFVERNQMG